MAKTKARTRKPAKQQNQTPHEPAPIRASGTDLQRNLKDKVARAAALATVFNAGLEYAKPEHWTPALSMLADLTNDAHQAAQEFIEFHSRFERQVGNFFSGVVPKDAAK